jgi:CHASE3 domain sensor protein
MAQRPLDYQRPRLGTQQGLSRRARWVLIIGAVTAVIVIAWIFLLLMALDEASSATAKW